MATSTGKDPTALFTAYKNGQSPIDIIKQEFENETDEEKIQKLANSLNAHFLNFLTEPLSDDEIESMIESSKSLEELSYKAISSIQTDKNSLDKAFRKALYEVKSRKLLGSRIKEHEGRHSEWGRDMKLSIIELSPIKKALIGFTYIFMTKKYRYMNDNQVKNVLKYDILKFIFTTILTISLTTLLIYLFNKLF